jgi:hypothetical protein
VLEAVFVLLESPSPSRRIFIGSHSFPPLWFTVSVLQCVVFFFAPMAPKADKAPPTFVFGRSKVSEAHVAKFVTSGFIKEGKGRAPGLETTPTPPPKRWLISGIYLPLDFVFFSMELSSPFFRISRCIFITSP